VFDAETKLNKLEEDMEILMPENKKLARELTDVRSRLEEESLKSTDLQNQLQTKEETLKFENSILEQELNETRIKKQMEISEIDSRISDAYETQMHQSMKELRETYDKQLSESREELSRVYDDKLNKLQARLDDAKTNNAGTEQEAREYQTKISVLTSRNVELEAANSSLQKRMAQILKEMEDKEANFRNEMAKKNALVKNKEEQMEETLKDYKKLLELKITLDCEIEAYRKMLEGEESRLGMSMTDSPDCSNGRGCKRTRTMLEESVTENATEHNGLGTIQIEPINNGEKSISLTNKMKEEISIGGWSLMNETEGYISTYKFHTSITLPPLSSCTVFSADCNEEHSPPTTLVMKKGGWVIGAQNKTVLTNEDGVEEAVRLSKAKKRQVGSIRSQDEKSCAIM
jgi:lamin B